MNLQYLIFFCFALGVICDDNLIIETNIGNVQGKYMEISSGKTIRAFLGIPYAEPPIGDLRFKPPVPKSKWDGIKETTKDYTACPQSSVFLPNQSIAGEEDCLFLNIFTPKEVTTDELPVMIWIHGGGFSVGTGNLDGYSPDYFMEKDVIIVSFNYRLGALGFFTTGDDLVYGNDGLKDQTLAIKWVKDNIEKFGGDSNSITIFGESAGSSSVIFHLLSRQSKGLFNAAIGQSGSVLNPWSLSTKEEVTALSKKLANEAQCPTDNTEKMIECLRKVDMKKIIQIQNSFYEFGADPLAYFIPIIEDKHPEAFIDKDPKEIIKLHESNDVPVIMGVNSNEGAFKLMSFVKEPDTLKKFDSDFNKYMKISVFVNRTIPNEVEVYKKTKEFYLKGKNMENAEPADVSDMYSDVWFVVGVDETISLFRKYHNNHVYSYLFGYNGNHSIISQFLPNHDLGVSHGDEAIYLFKSKYFQIDYKTFTDSDKKIVEILTTLWTSFATKKKPIAEGIDWKPVESKENEYLFIGDKIEMKNAMFKERIQFWKKF